MTWENYAIDIGSCYYLTKHYWQLKLLKFLDATFKKQCTVSYARSMDMEGYNANTSMDSATVEQRSQILGLCLLTLSLAGRLLVTLFSIFLFVTEILYMSSLLLITLVLALTCFSLAKSLHILAMRLFRESIGSLVGWT